MGLSERIAEAMGARQKGAFGEALGVSAAAVTQWLKGDTKSLKGEILAKMEIETGYRAVWIALGKGNKLVSDGTITRLPMSCSETALSALAACLDSIDPDLQPAAREAVMKWLNGHTTHDAAAVVLAKLPKTRPAAVLGNDRHAA